MKLFKSANMDNINITVYGTALQIFITYWINSRKKGEICEQKFACSHNLLRQFGIDFIQL